MMLTASLNFGRHWGFWCYFKIPVVIW